MSNTAEELITALSKLIQPQIPIAVDRWGPKECAAYLKVAPRYFSERIACKKGFPKSIRIPTEKGRGHPRWKAIDVIKWTEAQDD